MRIHASVDHEEVERVDEQGSHHEDDGQADAATAELGHDENADDADDDHHFVNARAKLNDGQRVECEVEETGSPDDHEQDVVPGNVVGADLFLVSGVYQKADDDDASEEECEPDFGQGRAEQRHADAVDGEDGHDGPDDDLGDAFPYARVGLTVELAQDLFGFVAFDGSGILVHDDVRALFSRDARLDFLADEVGVLDGLESLLCGLVRCAGVGRKVDDGLAYVDILLRGGATPVFFLLTLLLILLSLALWTIRFSLKTHRSHE